ncbi:MAG: hypothetical protein AAF497_17780 [Planctomycetota bacterium]
MRFIIGAILSAVLLFFWGFYYWTINPMASQIIQPVPNDAALVGEMTNLIGKSGVYYMPPMPTDENNADLMAEFTERHEAGPIARIFYRHEGATPMDPMTMLKGFLHGLLVSVLAGLILLAASPNSYPNRVMLIFWVGVFTAVWTQLSNNIWWYYPMNYCLLEMGYYIVGALLIGLAMGAFVRPAA